MVRPSVGVLSAAHRHFPVKLAEFCSISPVRQQHGQPARDFLRTTLSLCGLLLLLVSCRGALEPASLPPPSRFTTAEPLWQQLMTRRQAVQTLKGLAQAQFLSPTQNLAVDTVAVVLQHREAMRLEGIGALGQPLFVLVAAHNVFSFYVPQEARLLAGTASAHNLQRVFGLTLAPYALHALLLGDLPLETFPPGGPVIYRRGSHLYGWEGRSPQESETYRVWFDATHQQPVRFELEDLLGRVVLRVQYDDFRPLDGWWFPYRITADQPLVGQSVIWHYSAVQLNVSVRPTVFQIRVPAGTERVELE